MLNSLKSPDVLVRETIERIVAVVQLAPNEDCNQGLCTTQADMFLDVPQILGVVIA